MIFLASDHAGFELKKTIIDHLKSKGEEIEDCGPYELDPADDYPDFVYPCAHKVANSPGAYGIILGMSGNGEQICANYNFRPAVRKDKDRKLCLFRISGFVFRILSAISPTNPSTINPSACFLLKPLLIR